MNYSEVLSSAWQIIWKHKVLSIANQRRRAPVLHFRGVVQCLPRCTERGDRRSWFLDWVNAASFIMRAAPDALNPDDQSNAEHFFYGLDGLGAHGVKAPALYFDMGESGHASWLFLGKNLHVPRITARTMVAWLKAYFHGWSLEEYFTGKVVQKDIDAGYIAAVDDR